MINLYFKQAWQLLRENLLVSLLSIAGTALCISAVMLMVLVFQVRTAGYAPESNRGRMLFAGSTRAILKNENHMNASYMSEQVAREVYKSLPTPAAVTAFSGVNMPISLPHKRLYQYVPIRETDDTYWQVFNFSFLEGSAYTASDVAGALPKAVISDQFAATIFGDWHNAVGRTVVKGFVEFTIVGVVKRPSSAAGHTCADLWVPYTTNHEKMTVSTTADNIVGFFQVAILAHKASDFPAIRKEIAANVAAFNTHCVDWELKPNAIQSIYEKMRDPSGWKTSDEASWFNWLLEKISIALIVIVLPMLNMLGVTLTSFRKRRAEIGVRKAFGCSQGDIIKQVLYENLLITMIGGTLGLLLSFGLLSICKSIFLSSDMMLDATMLFRPEAFLATFILVFLLNLLSAGIPAWRCSRIPIIQSLKNAD